MKTETTETTTGTMRGAIHAVHQGYCWITGDDGVDRFAHRSVFLTPFDDVRRNDRVEFVPADAVRGPRAIDVRVLA